MEATLRERERWRREGEKDEGENFSVKWEYAIKICQIKIIIYTSYGLSKKEISSSKKTYIGLVLNKKIVFHAAHDDERKPKKVKSAKLLKEMVVYCKRVYVCI